MIHRRLVSLVVALLVSCLILSVGLWAGGYSMLRVVETLIRSSWLSPSGLVVVLSKSSLLILTGLAVAVPFRAGLFNIGGEGQFYAGGMAAALVGTMAVHGPMGTHLLLCLAAGVAAGGIWAGLAAWLKTARNIHEVISTIMLNFVAFQLVNELTLGWFQAAPGASRTAMIRESAHIPILYARGSGSVSWGIVLSMVIAVALSILLHRTWLGFQLRAVGNNVEAARYSGILCPRIQRYALMIGGGCAGLAGALETTGITHAFFARFTSGYGFDGIAIAFLAMGEPWAVIPASLFLATFRASDAALQLELGIPKEIVFAFEGILIICVAMAMRTVEQERHD